jgi:hypothetical protein
VNRLTGSGAWFPDDSAAAMNACLR